MAFQANSRKDISSSGLEDYHQLEGLLLLLSAIHECDGSTKVVKMSFLDMEMRQEQEKYQ